MSQQELSDNKTAQVIKPYDLPHGALKPVATNWCHSMSNISRVDFEWVVHNFEFQDLNTTALVSTPFSSEDNPNFKWKLTLHPADMSLILSLNHLMTLLVFHKIQLG